MAARHLTPLHLAHHPATPAPPRAGESALYPGADGVLRQLDAAGAVTLLPGRRRAVLGADWTHDALGTWVPVPLSIDVEPGLHRLTFRVEASTRDGAWSDLSLERTAGAASLGFGSTTFLLDNSANGYGYPMRWGLPIFEWWRAGQASLVATTHVLTRDPITVSLDAGLAYTSQSADFEGGLDWQIDGAAYVDDDAVAHGGGWSGKLTADGAGRGVFFDWFNTAPGTGWRLGGWLYAAEGHPLSGVAITWYDGDGVQISRLADERPLQAGAWTYVEAAGVAPAGTVELHAQIGMEETAGHQAGSTINVDDVLLRTTTGSVTVQAGSYLEVAPA
ncbi:hypothetical protein [Nonomuraea sp. NPDC003214]